MGKGEKDKQRRDGGKGILQPLRQLWLPPVYVASKLEKDCGSSVQIWPNRAVSTYHVAGKSIPVVQIFYSSSRASRETQTPLVWHRNLWKSNRVHNLFIFFIEGMENSLGTFLHRISLLPASQVELACFRAIRLPPLACTQCQQQHTSATILFQCLKYLFLSPHLRIQTT